MKKIFLLILVFAQAVVSQSQKPAYKIQDDDNSKFTNIGNVGLTVTNFGMYGHGFSLWPQQPSAE